MGRLVDQLLDLARLESGRVQMRRDRIDLARLTREAVRRFQPLAQEKTITLTAEVDDELWIEGDADRLMQVLVNLLDNALRHTPERGAVTCRAARLADAPGWAEVTVQDTGPGISSEDLPRVFDRFYQAEKARRRGGAGLGLAIVQEIVRAHGGSVGVRSPAGQGAIFWVRLPLQR
jgi:signal transduction histidine kinase